MSQSSFKEISSLWELLVHVFHNFVLAASSKRARRFLLKSIPYLGSGLSMHKNCI